MSSKHIDPRKDISHEIKSGQVYKDERNGEQMELVYLDNKHGLLKGNDGHAFLMKRNDLDRNVGAGRFKIQGDVEQREDQGHTPIKFETISGIGDVAATSLRTSGYSTVEDIKRASNDELLSCRGIGEGNLKNIYERIEKQC